MTVLSLRRWVLLWCVLMLAGLSSCGRRAIRIDLVPVEDPLLPQVVESDPGYFVHDKIALVSLSGLLINTKAGGLLGNGANQVSDLREQLLTIQNDESVKAIVLRINSPGGTVTAGDMMYNELQKFKATTHKPIVVSMQDVCASGGYYVSCAADYRMAYPTTITGSIGVIVQTLNFSGSLQKLGISAKAITSGPNKDEGSPLRPMTENDEKQIRVLVDAFYARFVSIVRAAPNHVKDADWPMVTDGRVFTGPRAVELGLIDEVGDLSAAIAKAKQLSGVSRAKVIEYTRSGEYKGSIYANAPGQVQPNTTVNLLNLNVDTATLMDFNRPGFFYLWNGQ